MKNLRGITIKKLTLFLITLALLFSGAFISCNLDGGSETAGHDTFSLSVIFDLNYDNQILSAETVLQNQTVNRPEAPGRSSEYFCGWYTEATCTNKYNFGTPVTTNLTLYGRWIHFYDSLASYLPNMLYDYDGDGNRFATITGYTGSKSDIIIPSNGDDAPVAAFSDNAFENNTTLGTVEICHGISSISSGAFQDCINLTSVSIPDSVTSIGTNAFSRCTKLSAATLPDSVTTIEDSAFQGCTSLTSITCKATTPPGIGDTVFDNTNNASIYVPSGSVDAYKDAGGYWDDYTDRIEAEP